MGVVNFSTSRTSGLISTIQSAGKQGSNQTSTIVLGNASDTKTNNITLGGIVDNLNVTGADGQDIINFTDSNKIKSVNFNLGTGLDKIDFTNLQNTNGSLVDNGLAVNLSDSNFNVLTRVSIPPALVLSGGNESDIITKLAIAEFKPGSDQGKT